jgi:hypothetical protein
VGKTLKDALTLDSEERCSKRAIIATVLNGWTRVQHAEGDSDIVAEGVMRFFSKNLSVL